MSKILRCIQSAVSGYTCIAIHIVLWSLYWDVYRIARWLAISTPTKQTQMVCAHREIIINPKWRSSDGWVCDNRTASGENVAVSLADCMLRRHQGWRSLMRVPQSSSQRQRWPFTVRTWVSQTQHTHKLNVYTEIYTHTVHTHLFAHMGLPTGPFIHSMLKRLSTTS